MMSLIEYVKKEKVKYLMRHNYKPTYIYTDRKGFSFY